MIHRPEFIEITDDYEIQIFWDGDTPTVELCWLNPRRNSWDLVTKLRVAHYEDLSDVYAAALRLVAEHQPGLYTQACGILEPEMEGL